MLEYCEDPLSSSICDKNVSPFGLKTIFGHLMGETLVFLAIFVLLDRWDAMDSFPSLLPDYSPNVLVQQFHFVLREDVNE